MNTFNKYISDQHIKFIFICITIIILPSIIEAQYKHDLAYLVPVSASSSADNQPAFLAIDGNDNTYWESLEIGSPHWLTIHLNEKTKIDRVIISNFTGFNELAVKVWRDSSWVNVFQGSAQSQVLFGFDPVLTEKIRLEPITNNTVRIYNVEIMRANAQPVYLNQSGFNIDRSKIFTAPMAEDGSDFFITRKNGSKILYKGKLQNRKGDFTEFKPVDPGPYLITVDDGNNMGTSLPFKINPYWLERVSYQPAINFMIDSRCWWGDARNYSPTDTNSDCTRGVAWRDGVQYSFEISSLIKMYLANPDAFDTDRMPVQGPYIGLRHELPETTPEIIRLIYWGVDIMLRGEVDQALLKEQLAYFLYAYPYMKQYIPESVYHEAREYLFKRWGNTDYNRYPAEDGAWNIPDVDRVPHTADLFQTYTEIGTGKGQFPPGHSIVPNLMMYEVAKREGREDAQLYFNAAYAQTEWLIENLDWQNPKTTKGQRQGEWITITSFSYFQNKYPEKTPDRLIDKIDSWAKIMIERSDNMWDFRRYSDDKWIIPSIRPETDPGFDPITGFNEPGNVAGFPAALLAATKVIENQSVNHRLRELAVSHFDNVFGRNPTGRHFSYDAKTDFEGADLGWFQEYQGGAGQLQSARGVLDGSPKETTYPYNPYAGDPGHTEGWVTFNTAWNVALAWFAFDATKIELYDENFIERIKSVKIGDTVGVRLYAPLNFDSERREKGHVNVQTGRGEKFQIEVIETNTNSLYFEAKIHFSESETDITQNVIQVQPGDKISISYGLDFFKRKNIINIID